MSSNNGSQRRLKLDLAAGVFEVSGVFTDDQLARLLDLPKTLSDAAPHSVPNQPGFKPSSSSTNVAAQTDPVVADGSSTIIHTLHSEAPLCPQLDAGVPDQEEPLQSAESILPEIPATSNSPIQPQPARSIDNPLFEEQAEATVVESEATPNDTNSSLQDPSPQASQLVASNQDADDSVYLTELARAALQTNASESPVEDMRTLPESDLSELSGSKQNNTAQSQSRRKQPRKSSRATGRADLVRIERPMGLRTETWRAMTLRIIITRHVLPCSNCQEDGIECKPVTTGCRSCHKIFAICNTSEAWLKINYVREYEDCLRDGRDHEEADLIVYGAQEGLLGGPLDKMKFYTWMTPR